MVSTARPHVLGIIPARGGSKGVPRKNVQPLAGKPLIAWTIEAAKRARGIDRLVVSTDDSEIADVSKRFGAEVVRRPAEISGDAASSESALLHTLDFLRDAENYVPDCIAFLQCTSPLTLPVDIDGTVAVLAAESADTALAVTPFHHFLWRSGASGDAVGVNHDKLVRLRRQERQPDFLETGAVYVMRTAGFRQNKHRFFGKTSFYIVPPERSLEIDEPLDFRMAEVLLQQRAESGRIDPLPPSIGALVLDFDGVFTDNRVIVMEDGTEAVACNRSDGWGLAQLRKTGLPIVVISTETNPVVTARCRKLGLDVLQGIADKHSALDQWLAERKIPSSQVVYVGNDVNDLSCLESVGCGVAVRDAHPLVLRAARLVLSSLGGAGAIRELTELIEHKLKHQVTGGM